MNIGTPSVENVTVLQSQANIHKSRLNLTIKFHYSPDGKRDAPGYGSVDLMPMRDFVDTKGQWVGGCKEHYLGWSGSTDRQVQQAIARVHPYSKIGQRDVFSLLENGVINQYYLYEVNMNTEFNWKDWRIVLYSLKYNRAVQIPFSFDRDEDLANPRISLLSYNS